MYLSIYPVFSFPIFFSVYLIIKIPSPPLLCNEILEISDMVPGIPTMQRKL